MIRAKSPQASSVQPDVDPARLRSGRYCALDEDAECFRPIGRHEETWRKINSQAERNEKNRKLTPINAKQDDEQDDLDDTMSITGSASALDDSMSLPPHRPTCHPATNWDPNTPDSDTSPKEKSGKLIQIDKNTIDKTVNQINVNDNTSASKTVEVTNSAPLSQKEYEDFIASTDMQKFLLSDALGSVIRNVMNQKNAKPPATKRLKASHTISKPPPEVEQDVGGIDASGVDADDIEDMSEIMSAQKSKYSNKCYRGKRNEGSARGDNIPLTSYTVSDDDEKSQSCEEINESERN